MKAKYSIFIPAHARYVAQAAHHYLSYGPLQTLHATVQYGHPDDELVVYAEETPKMDSHMKQLGVFVAEVANLPVTKVVKQTGKNIHTWDMRNVSYQPPAPTTF